MKGGEVFDHFMLCALEANLFLILGQFIFQGLRKIITIAKDINWTGLIVDKPIPKSPQSNAYIFLIL